MGCLKSKSMSSSIARPDDEYEELDEFTKWHPNPTAWEFDWLDSSNCRKYFRDIEKWYNEDVESYREDEQKIYNYMSEILGKM